MKRTRWFALSALVAAALGGLAWRALTPKIERATRAEIVAAFPASLRVEEAPDPEGEARYARLLKLAEDAPRLQVAALDALLDEGAIRFPADGGDRFPEYAQLKALAKELQNRSNVAAGREDRAECLRLVRTNLRLGQALTEAGGELTAHTVAIAVEAIAGRAAYQAEMRGGLDAAGRAAVLGLLPPVDPAKELARIMRRELYGLPMAFMLHPESGGGDYYGLASDPKAAEKIVGTFDPLATARDEGRMYESAIQNLSRPLGAQSDLPLRIAAAAAKGLPDEDAVRRAPDGFPKTLAKLVYRVRMNNGTNTIGRTLVSIGVIDAMPKVAARRSADRNLLRSVFLLRAGKAVSLPDPFGKGPLRVDPKRRLVWSVGEDGKDDGGSFKKVGSRRDPDFGYRY